MARIKTYTLELTENELRAISYAVGHIPFNQFPDENVARAGHNVFVAAAGIVDVLDEQERESMEPGN